MTDLDGQVGGSQWVGVLMWQVCSCNEYYNLTIINNHVVHAGLVGCHYKIKFPRVVPPRGGNGQHCIRGSFKSIIVFICGPQKTYQNLEKIVKM